MADRNPRDKRRDDHGGPYIRFDALDAFESKDRREGWCSNLEVSARLNRRPLGNAPTKFFEGDVLIYDGRTDNHGHRSVVAIQLDPGHRAMRVQVTFPDGNVVERTAPVKVPSISRKTAKEREVDRTKLELELARLQRELREATKALDPQTKKLAKDKLALEIAKVRQDLDELGKQPTAEEQRLKDLKLGLEIARVEHDVQSIAEDPEAKRLSGIKLATEIEKASRVLEEARKQVDPQAEELAKTNLALEVAKARKALEDFQKPPSAKKQEFDALDLDAKLAKARKDIADLTRVEAIPSVFFSGRPGKWEVTITVGTKEGALLSGFTGRIVDGTKSVSFTTGPDGSYKHSVNNGKADRAFEVITGPLPHQIWSATLIGRRSR